MQRIHDKIAECDREAELRGWNTSGFPRLWFAALSRVAGLDLQERRRKARHPADGSIPLPVTRDTSPGIFELQQQNDELRSEIARLREERKPVAWCVQAAAGSMFHAWTHTPIDASVLIQCKDLADARMMTVVYGHKILAVIEPDEKEVTRE
jgi:hypothetical protein